MHLIANLDTSRITQLVQEPERPGVSEWVALLQGGSVALALCISRVVELARLPDAQRDEVMRFLRDVPTVLGQPEAVLEEDELASACARVSGLDRRPPKPFARDTSDWGVVINAPGGKAADLVASSHWDESPDEFRQLADEQAVHAQALRERAVVVSDRSVVLRNELARHVSDFRSRTPSYAAGRSAEEIISAVGGLVAFPAFYVFAELLAARLVEHGGGEPNDLLDEDIARYHAYSAVSVYDDATCARFRQAQLEWRERAASNLAGALKILRKVEDGDLAVTPFFLGSAA